MQFCLIAVRHRGVHHGVPVPAHDAQPGQHRGRTAVLGRHLLQSPLHGVLGTVQHRAHSKGPLLLVH